MKTLIMISNLNQVNLKCDGVIIGIKGLSVNMPAYFELEEAFKKFLNGDICKVDNEDLAYYNGLLYDFQLYVHH